MLIRRGPYSTWDPGLTPFSRSREGGARAPGSRPILTTVIVAPQSNVMVRYFPSSLAVSIGAPGRFGSSGSSRDVVGAWFPLFGDFGICSTVGGGYPRRQPTGLSSFPAHCCCCLVLGEPSVGRCCLTSNRAPSDKIVVVGLVGSVLPVEDTPCYCCCRCLQDIEVACGPVDCTYSK